jgi:hypothetical protein
LAESTKSAIAPLVNINEMNMENIIEPSGGVKTSAISAVAYQMWEKAGRPAGRDLQFWLDAEAQLRTAAKAAAAKPVAPLSSVASGNNGVYRVASMRRGPGQPNSAKA